MYFDLTLAVIASVVVIYTPGYFIGRLINFDRLTSLLLAPIFTTAAYVILGVFLADAKISCSPVVFFAIALGIGILSTTIKAIIEKKEGLSKGNPATRIIHFTPPITLMLLFLYFAIALLITYIVFISVLTSSDALARYDDNTFHYSLIRTFIDTGTYSTSMNGFYPSAWHIQAAIVSYVFESNVSLASNSQLIAYLVFIIPSGVFLLLSQIFETKRIVAFGALFSISFSAFPWGFIEFGQLTPNLMSFAFIPYALSIFISFMQATKDRWRIGQFAVFSVMSLLAIAIAQPNGLFTLGVLLICYLTFSSIFDFKLNVFVISPTSMLKLAAIVAIALLLWVVSFNLPFLQGVINVSWPANHSTLGALREALLFIYTARGGIQLLMSFAVFIGILTTFKHRRYLWMTASYLFTLILFVIGDSSDGFLKHFASGFWYTDPYRTAAMNALCALPLAVLGFSQMVGLLSSAFAFVAKRIHPLDRPSSLPIACSITLLVLLMGLAQFTNLATFRIGERDLQTGLLAVREQIELRYSPESWLTAQEIDFAEKAMEAMPEGALVINIPNDGSEWLHGYLGLNTYFRRVIFGDSSDQSDQIRGRLNEISTSKEVQEAVRNAGAHYVLILDDKAVGDNTILDYAYDPERWIGIDSITEDTDGFELILSEGDMRLYEIDERFFR